MRIELERQSDPLLDEYWKHAQYLHANPPPPQMLIVIVHLLREVAELTAFIKDIKQGEWE